MPREKELYRDNLMRIDQAFPNQELLKCHEVAKWLGIDPRTARKRFKFDQYLLISKTKLASELS